MKASMHAGRTTSKGKAYNVNHNDRKFEQVNSKDYDTHIDWEKSSENVYYAFKMKEPEQALWVNSENYNLRDIELGFYKNHFGAHLKHQNEKHIKSRHKERCKSIEDIYTNPRTCPQETILQVGKDGEYQDYKKFKKMVKQFCSSYNAQHCNNSMIVSCAIHADETSLHAHVRRVFYVKDEQGNLELAQNKALKKMGYELPHPEAKRSKYNNRLQAFTDEMRGFWQDIIENTDKSIKIDREPNTASQKHLEKLDYQNKASGEKLERLESQMEDAKKMRDAIHDQIKEMKTEAVAIKDIMEFAKGTEEEPEISYTFKKKAFKNDVTVIEGITPERTREVFELASNLQIYLQREREEREKLKADIKAKELSIYEREVGLEQAKVELKKQIATAVANEKNARKEIIEERERFEQEKEQFGKNRYAQGFNDGKESRRKEIIRFLKVISEYQHLERTYPDVEKALKQARSVEELKKRMEKLEKLEKSYDDLNKDDDWDFER